MAHRHADIAEHGAVREVALQAADGQLLTQVCQDGVGYAEVALRVLEVDGVHLVGHRTGAHLAGLYLLSEVLHRDVLPEVAVQVDDDGVDALHGIEHSAQAVVVAYLCGVLLTFQSEALADEATAKLQLAFSMTLAIGLIIEALT